MATSSVGRRIVMPVRPDLTALRDDLALPASLAGPVLRWGLAWLAATCLGEDIEEPFLIWSWEQEPEAGGHGWNSEPDSTAEGECACRERAPAGLKRRMDRRGRSYKE